MLWQAADEVAPDAGKGDDPSSLVVVHARVVVDDACALARRLEEYAASDLADQDDERVFGFVSRGLRDRSARPRRRGGGRRVRVWPRGGLWRHGDFLKLWSAETISQFGSQITGLALPLVAIITLTSARSRSRRSS